MPEVIHAPILCSTARLARSLRASHHETQRAAGFTQWQPLPALTLNQWLDAQIEEALLKGHIPLEETPRLALNNAQELELWKRVIERALTGEASALFDLAGLAKAAMDANKLMQEWNIAVPDVAMGLSEEVSQFLLWRSEFRKQCEASGWLERTRYLDWQIAQIAKGVAALPVQVFIAGFDRISPQEQRFLDALKSQGVVVQPWQHLLLQTSGEWNIAQISFADSDAECRAAVAWVSEKLKANPHSRLAIVSPELAKVRERIAALLDDTLQPAAISPASAEMPRIYDFSLGHPLSREPLIAAALDLLRLAASRRSLAQQDFSRLLLGPYWSTCISEADERAQLDARMKRDLPGTVSLERLVRYAQKQRERGLGIPQTLQHLQALLDALIAAPARQLPSAWAQAIGSLLRNTGWPGERSLSSHEFQAQQSFSKALAALGDFDLVHGAMSFPQAVQRLALSCNEQVFQPESAGNTQVLVMGMLETVAAPLDAMWVMGMNDHVWPPPADPNPLIPASMQRTVRAPNADGVIQAEFAHTIHQRLLKSAHEVVFSWAHKSGESELRSSPLMENIPSLGEALPLAKTMAERLAQDCANPELRQWLDDHVGPPIAAGERISGGAGLIRAQAICPAWAYYRYRLGARRLDEPVDGLDAMDRGNLVHLVLQSFWQGRDSDYLHQLDETGLQTAVETAINNAVERFNKMLEEPLQQNFILLEKERLRYLLNAWLRYEKQRPPFVVEQCEQQAKVELGGMTINLTLDRVDRLSDGKLVVIDYKTGGSITHSSWAEKRISEPQLPIYTTLVLSGENIAAVCFAQVRADEQRFVGIAAEADVLPGIKALQEADKLFPPEAFPDWITLLSHWKSSIETIAHELICGEAAVMFQLESDLLHCDVKPLLRLPERYLQIEAMHGKPHGR
ncbi:MAG TPA: PD-(D/E)XK nuclease family protein [Methylophilaceae bacterium]|nr:PD-(D/E)XK nuclease family protein [Methylophilaceae bacterium]